MKLFRVFRPILSTHRKFSIKVQGQPISLTNSRLPNPDYDFEYLCNPSNRNEIFENIRKRKSQGDIDKVLELSQSPELRDTFLAEINTIPNHTAEEVMEYGENPQVIRVYGKKAELNFECKRLSELAKHLQLMKTDRLGPLTGQKSYILLTDLADMEQALVQYSVDKLIKNNFKLVSVPDIISSEIIKRCGLISKADRTLVYCLDSQYGENVSLSGTAEMSMAQMLMNTEFTRQEIPLKLAAVSRCYRAETSTLYEERGIYRVHQFTKVEMFVCCEPEESSEFLHKIQEIQENLFSNLDLHFKVLDMPPHELGASAYRKMDIEGWMPGRKQFGELSSCSNCTDYQSRRLNIKYRSRSGKLLHVHTLNGTACAIPRMLIAICETHQTKDGDIKVPKKLIPYMQGKTLITKQSAANMKPHKLQQNI
ncbi:serine--tRNA ligase, mitochondrial [Orussus abietinus]|uniref:serine--tRNA ligase, mitochondrial n=1 Tax=Orussus abietinus TaxID=222816 RepID=UPI0006254C6C|nr:serine--tRNA ligase, mitochondrial [Orussus abietinus]XP_012281657.1 serine--tRNA ligase, mitochondrial [Orussus abietinus]XP_012281658.1 serine--tRNA ligase, mitochondrial [Orussus abietinus]